MAELDIHFFISNLNSGCKAWYNGRVYQALSIGLVPHLPHFGKFPDFDIVMTIKCLEYFNICANLYLGKEFQMQCELELVEKTIFFTN